MISPFDAALLQLLAVTYSVVLNYPFPVLSMPFYIHMP